MSDLERRGLNGSLLTVFASQKNNHSKIACVVVVKNNSLVSYKSEDAADLIVYGRYIYRQAVIYMQGIILCSVSFGSIVQLIIERSVD